MSSSKLFIDSSEQINLSSNQASATALSLNASNASGGLQVNVGTGGVNINSIDGRINLDSKNAQVNLHSAQANTATSIALNASSGTGGITLLSGTGNTRVSTTGDISLESSTADGVVIRGVGANIGAHLSSRQDNSSPSSLRADGKIGTTVVTAYSTDMAGIVQVNSSGSGGNGSAFTVTFDQAYSLAPAVVVMPTNAAHINTANAIQVVSTTTGFTVTYNSNAATSCNWHYIVVGFPA